MIQRYDLELVGSPFQMHEEMIPCENGDWVRSEDYDTEVNILSSTKALIKELMDSADVTERNAAKLVCEKDPEFGDKVEIYWNHEMDDIVDHGYLMALPEYHDIDCDSIVHIPKPQNPGGKDEAPSEWRPLNGLLKNPYVVKVVIDGH